MNDLSRCRQVETRNYRLGWRGLLMAVALLLAASPGFADNLEEARRLLRITEIAREFDQATRQQTRNIIRTYSSIVAMSTDLVLPESIKQEITQCYEQAYAWENFEAGIAAIFAENLSHEELTLLIDFFSDRSVPPPRIGQFKALIARAEAIEQMALDYMLTQAEGCDARNVNLILDYVAAQGR